MCDSAEKISSHHHILHSMRSPPKCLRNECNKFCLDCNDNVLCRCCIKSSHKDHRVIQMGVV